MSRWEWVVDARGHQAEERWREWIHDVRAEEYDFPVRLMWGVHSRTLSHAGEAALGDDAVRDLPARRRGWRLDSASGCVARIGREVTT